MQTYRSEITVSIGNADNLQEKEEDEGRGSPDMLNHDSVRGLGLLEPFDRKSRERSHVQVQRSKSDVRHEHRFIQIRRSSNFELAYLLERGKSLDAKLFGAINDDEDNDNTSVASEGMTIILPIRLRQALETKRRRSSSSRSHPPRTPLCGSLQGSTISISGPLDSLPELQPLEVVNRSNSTQAERIRDIEATIPWLQHQIRSLKQQDRKLFRQLLGLGTEIHRLVGMDSCQSYSTSLDMDDMDNSPRMATGANFTSSNDNNADLDKSWNDDWNKNSSALSFGSSASSSFSSSVPATGAKVADQKSKSTTFRNSKLLELCSSLESFFR